MIHSNGTPFFVVFFCVYQIIPQIIFMNNLFCCRGLTAVKVCGSLLRTLDII